MSQIAVSTRAHRRAVATPTGPLAVLDTGPGDTGRPPLLLVHGYTGSKEDFLPLLDPLAEAGWRVVSMDQRGQYESPGVDDPAAYTVAALAADLLAVAEDVGTPVHVLGHSFGGLVARAAAIAAPSSFASVVLLDSGPAGLGGARRERIGVLRPVLATGGMTAVYAAMEQLAAGDPRWRDRPPELRDFLRQRFLASSPVGLEATGNALIDEPDRVAELRATGLPVLVCYGEADDAWSPAVQAEMADRLGARHVVIPDAIHSPAIENTPVTLHALLQFWDSADRTAGPATGMANAG